MVDATASIHLHGDEVGFAQQIEVLHDQEAVLAHGVGEVTGRARLVAQHVEDPPPMRIGESAPDVIEIFV